VDPDGLIIDWVQGEGVSDTQFADIKGVANDIMESGTTAGNRFKELNDNPNVVVTINVNSSGQTNTDAVSWNGATDDRGSDSVVDFNINDKGNYIGENVEKDLGASLVHEVSGHSYDNFKGVSPYNGSPGKGTWLGRLASERNAVAMENEYRAYAGMAQRQYYNYGQNRKWDMPIYDGQTKSWYMRSHRMFIDGRYNTLIGPAAKWK
jgi:hypothetical protein